MRFLCLLFIICCFASCKVNKDIIAKEETEKTTINAEKTADGIVEVIKDTIEIPIEETQKVNTENHEFNQIVTKRTISSHDLWNELLQKYVSEDGKVDYQGLKSEKEDFYGYIHILNLIYQHESFNILSQKQKLAYWINAYNVFTVDLILRNHPVKSIKNIKNPWKQRYWKLGDKWYNLDEIEHQILRKMDEPRIHFAINCASISCPKLQNKAFTQVNLEEQLTKATNDFLNDSSKNNLSKDKIHISKLFQWFAKDFKKKGSLIDFLNQYSKFQISNKAKKSFMDYNWDLNE
ncbi:DUF547 domain-containing protein [Seonamhaeicola maritimus]|uniref:DUF547 domain-containing protein n=1 Tax=Seonamhaeicola maritimus TaxID=2591822 RepID=A0A5C7GH40_9FLAO|nr:DUF547 domain-containing protein [Seonamhaeicola maritimus]TXG36611.1 DUF547 domain-containing protein [Seonamhaeicola maritimus]